MNILSRSELANNFSFSLPQIDQIFSSKPPDQTTSWVQITRLDQTGPDQTMCFGQTIGRDRLRQTRLDQLSFLPQTTQPDQLPLTDHPVRPAFSWIYQSASHYHNTPSLHRPGRHVRYVSQVRSILCGLGHGRLIYKALDDDRWPLQCILSTHFRLEVPGLVISALRNRS